MWHTWSVFFVAIYTEFGWSRAETSLAFSIASMMTALTSPFAGGLIDRFGVRKVMPASALLLAGGIVAMSFTQSLFQLYITYGVVVGIGMVLTGTVPNFTLIQKWFQRYRGLAMGGASAGIGLGMLILVPATQGLIEAIGWRRAAWALAILIAIGIPTLVLLFQLERPEDMGLRPDGLSTSDGPSAAAGRARSLAASLVVDRKWAATSWTWQEAIRTYRYWVVFVSCFLASWGTQTMLTHMVADLIDVGYDAKWAAAVYGFVGISGSLGKFGWGAISDRIGREMAATLGASCAAIGIAVLSQVHSTAQPWLLVPFVAMYGLGYGSVPPLRPTIVADLFQGRGFGAIYGSVEISAGLGGLIAPWLAGYLYDTTNTYQLAFALAAAGYLLSAFGFWLAGPRKVRLVPGRGPKLSQGTTTTVPSRKDGLSR